MSETTVVTPAQVTLFRNCFYNCEALRRIIAFADSKGSTLQWDNNPKVPREIFQAATLKECSDLVVMWRITFSIEWKRLEANNLMIMSLSEWNARSYDELVDIHKLTSDMLRSLEARLIGILLRSHQQTPVH